MILGMAVVLVSIGVPGISADAQVGGQTDLKALVLASVRRNESLFRNFETRFTIQWYDADGNRQKPSGDRESINEERWRYAREGNKILAVGETDWSNGRIQKDKQVFNGERMKYYREDLKTGLVRSEKTFPTSVVPDRFTNLYQNVGDLTMSEFLEASTIKTISPCEIKGSRGFLVQIVHKDSTADEPVEQKIYFDADKGFVPVIVETYQTEVSRTQPVLMTEVQEFQKINEEIYFPRKARSVLYTLEEGQERWTVASEVRIEVSDTTVNTELAKDMFTLVYPPGTSVYDETVNITYRVGATPESLDAIDDLVVSETEVSSGRAHGNEPAEPRLAENDDKPANSPDNEHATSTADSPSGSQLLTILSSGSFWLSTVAGVGLATFIYIVAIRKKVNK